MDKLSLLIFKGTITCAINEAEVGAEAPDLNLIIPEHIIRVPRACPWVSTVYHFASVKKPYAFNKIFLRNNDQ